MTLTQMIKELHPYFSICVCFVILVKTIIYSSQSRMVLEFSHGKIN